MTPDKLREKGNRWRELGQYDLANIYNQHAAALEEIERLNAAWKAQHAAWKAQQFHLEAEERESAHWKERAERAESRAERLKGHADDGPPLTPHGEAIAAGDGTLHGAIDYWQEQAFTMAAGQCCVKSGGLMADDHGNAYCDMQRQRDEAERRAERLKFHAEAMAAAIERSQGYVNAAKAYRAEKGE